MYIHETVLFAANGSTCVHSLSVNRERVDRVFIAFGLHVYAKVGEWVSS